MFRFSSFLLLMRKMRQKKEVDRKEVLCANDTDIVSQSMKGEKRNKKKKVCVVLLLYTFLYILPVLVFLSLTLTPSSLSSRGKQK